MTTTALLIQLVATFAIGTTILYMALSILKNRLMKKYSIALDNTSFALLCGSVLFSIAYLFAGINQPLISTLKIIQQSSQSSLMTETAKYTGLFLFIVAVAALSVISASFFIYSSIMKGNKSMDEVKNNNTAVSILTAVIIISLSIMVKENLVSFLESFIPYPTTPVVF